jgi:predicted phage terminase large subunit-like protein
LYGLLIKNELSGKHQVIRAIAADDSTPWPEKFSLEWLENRKQQMGSAIFATQYQNDVELMKGDIFREEWFRYYEEQQEWELFEHWIGCDPAATRADVLLSGRKAETDYWTIVVGARRKEKEAKGGFGREVYVREVWRGRCTKQEYVDRLQAMHDRYKPRRVIVEDVAAQEYLAQDLEKLMRIKRLKRTKDKVSRAYDLQGYLENGQILFPAPHLQLNRDAYTALQDELVLFPNADHDDLFDGLQTAVEGAFDRSGEMGVWFPTPAYEEEDDPHPWAHSRSTWPWWPR